MQKTIDLEAGFRNHSSAGDLYAFFNNEDDLKVKYSWKSQAIEVDLDQDEKYSRQFFTSNFGAGRYSIDKRFDAVSFTFHSPSEHTIEGKRFDLELQILHKAKNPLNGNKFAV